MHGPQAYISPSWYESKARHGRVVPTWNYETVHLTGHADLPPRPRVAARVRDPADPAARGRPARIRGRSPTPRPTSSTASCGRIVGVELTITSVEAKQKLSQNRSAADQDGAIAGLRAEPGPGPAAIADLMTANLPAADPRLPARASHER